MIGYCPFVVLTADTSNLHENLLDGLGQPQEHLVGSNFNHTSVTCRRSPGRTVPRLRPRTDVRERKEKV
jgi:hypothetical protein